MQLNQSGENTYNLNQLTPAQLTLGTKLQQTVPNPFFGLINVGALAAATVPAGALITSFPQFPQVYPLYMSGSTSNYQSLQIRGERRFNKGMSFMLTYTFDKLMDDYSIIANPAGTPPSRIFTIAVPSALSLRTISRRSCR